jgi:NitT/TauT family transport system substrate-binding protein
MGGTIRSWLAVGLCALGLAAAPARAEEISVTHWGNLMYGVPYAVAQEKGFFKKAGVDVTGILTSTGGGTTVRNVLAGNLLFGETSLAAAVAAKKAGQDILVVSAAVESVGDILWVTMPNSPLKSIKDLVGKKASFTSPKSVTEMLLILSLEVSGIPLDKVDKIAAGSIANGLTALKEGGVAAAAITEPVWSKNKDQFRDLFWSAEILPAMTQTVGITTGRAAKQKPKELRAIIEGRRQGVAFIYQNPKESGAILAKAYNLDLAVAETAVNNLVRMKYWGTGKFDYAAMDNMVKGLLLTGELTEKVDWKTIVDTSFLPDDLRS